VPRAKGLQKITLGRFLAGCILVAGLYMILIATFEQFVHWPYFKLLLICVMGFTFLIITYILKH